MATLGTSWRRRPARLVSRIVRIAAISRLSREIRVRIRRRSVSIFVSPGPRRPTPPPRRRPAATTGLPGQRLTPTAQARQEVLQLRQLDLGLALMALGVLGEDVQDQRRPVDDLDLDLAPPGCAAGRARARRRRSPCPRRTRPRPTRSSLDLAPTDEGRRVRSGAALDQPVEHLRTGGLGQLGQLGQRVLRVGAVPSVHTPTRTTRSSRSWRYSTSVMSASSVDSPATRRSALRSASSKSSAVAAYSPAP